MFLADYHTHSHASMDGHVSIMEMAQAAIHAGLQEYCITDHAECMGFFDRGHLPEHVKYFYKELVDKEFAEAQEVLGSKIKLLKGIELAQGHEAPEVYNDLVRHDWDFVINSIHNLRGETDFYYIEDFGTKERCEEMLDRYIKEIFETVYMSDYDVIAHIGYPLRYMCHKQGFDVSLDAYQAELTELFRLIVSKGKGIELNVSGLRDGGNVTFPTLNELKLYRECGGEIITIGSDAHYPHYVGVGIERGQELLREAGFRYITAFEKRVPRFEKL